MLPMMKKFAATLLALILTVSLLTACSKGEQTAAVSGDGSSEEGSSQESSAAASELTQEEALAMLAEDVNEMREKEAQKDGSASESAPSEESTPAPQEASGEPSPEAPAEAASSSQAEPAEPETPQQMICRESLNGLQTVLNPGSPAPAEETKPAISKDEQSKVSNLLQSIPPESLDLYTDISNYKLYFSADTTEVEGKECYNVQAVKKDTLRKEIMGMYYVATDESAVFKYDVLTGASIPVELDKTEQ